MAAAWVAAQPATGGGLHAQHPGVHARSASTPPLAVEAWAKRTGHAPPTRVSFRLTRTAHVAVFEVRPGVGARMRYPRSRRQDTRFAAGLHHLPLEATALEGERFRGFPGRPLSGIPPGAFGRAFSATHLLVVASADPLWLSGFYLDRVFLPRSTVASVGALVEAVLEEVLPHPAARRWAFDLHPGRPFLRHLFLLHTGPAAPPWLVPPPRRNRLPPSVPDSAGGRP